MHIGELIDRDVLQHWQDSFCKAHGLYMVCIGKNGRQLTELEASDEEKKELELLFPKDIIQQLWAYLRNTRHIHEAEEINCGLNFTVCTQPVQISGETQIVWLVMAVLMDYSGKLRTISREQLGRELEYLAESTRNLFAAKMGEVIAEEAMRDSVASEMKMEKELHRSNTMTSIMMLMEKEGCFKSTMKQILQLCCEELDVCEGFVVQNNEDTKEKEIICNYTKNEEPCEYADKSSIACGKETEWMDVFCMTWDKQVNISLPVYENEELVMSLCFYDAKGKRDWNIEEQKFGADVRHIVQEIYTKRAARKSLTSSYAALKSILESTGCGICVVDYNSRTLLYTNRTFQEMLGDRLEQSKIEQMIYEKSDRVGTVVRDLFIPHSKSWVDVSQNHIHWVDGREVTLCTFYDVTDRKEYQNQIEKQANNDFLTGLRNRMRCELDLESVIEDVQKNEKAGALIYLDLDDFKNINDGLGHAYGDLLLKEISRSLRKIEGIKNNCYRMGGDEFIVIVPQGYYDQVKEIANKIQEIFVEPWILKEEEYYCTMCMGIVCFPEDADTVEEVIRKADLALYEAKRKGRNCIVFYSEMDSGSQYRRLDIEKNIRKATMNACEEFEVYYQPIMDVYEEDKCCGAEALARWNSTEMGFISPGDFIPIAEYLGVINQIGEYILRQAAKQCKHWNDSGHPDYHVNVNLSVIQLLQNDIVGKVKAVIDDTGINPKNLRLEVTESLAINDIERMKMILEQIRSLGVGVALDDFGTGYSSLNHIRELPIDVIKIDRCFIKKIAEDDFAQSFVSMVTELAKAINVMICVEGVENIQQYHKVKEAKIHMIQGYYFGKPMQKDEFEEKFVKTT